LADPVFSQAMPMLPVKPNPDGSNSYVPSDASSDPVGTSASPLYNRSPDGILTCTTSITRPSDTTAYAALDAYSDSTSAPTSGGFTFTSAARASGKSVILTDLVVTNSNAAATPLQATLFLFDTAITNINDNAAFTISDSEILTLVAKIPFTMGTGAANNHVHLQNLNIGITTVGSANLRFAIRVENVYTPASAEVLTLRAKFLPVD
jgi:hypothetical protein